MSPYRAEASSRYLDQQLAARAFAHRDGGQRAAGGEAQPV